jgi:broad specificity phosphatase PhoE
VPPRGESWPVFGARVAAAVEALGRRGGTWVVVTHGGCVRAATAYVTGARVDAVGGPANTSLTILELAPRRRLLVLNRTSGPVLPRPSEPGGA